MIRLLPIQIINNIKTYLEIWDKFKISQRFISTLQQQLEWPRDANGYANSAISYYSNVRLPKNRNYYPVIDLYLGHYKLVKYPYNFSIILKENTVIIGINYKCTNIQHILNAIWSQEPLPRTLNVFKNYIDINYKLINYCGYHIESNGIGEAQLLNHWLELVKKITATK